MNLLAPIGYGTKDPNFLPLFPLYNFDFIRRSKTQINANINDKEIRLINFLFLFL
ncbi:hypothetical protein H8356DRAFT_1028221 [Neocallimastix lanati (nom. inval.)]|uniref:Uncharacterized protein n=1 Tax=Neocallimastix californiae TaxID=1754190 RepID=A0A1Y2ERD3_9FUNG|nr:hypothetical protein H8356DRAFT_1028221 [Neocallimastix sp. JGI-2020a]ORY74151.1 hypothetical protein LY90DRAFT_699336 [Neocallimastix californiae]|eukprot:ORY74151.1 hypothetical protein LY90DRAFT_699336 [Neocallimastix californiae]